MRLEQHRLKRPRSAGPRVTLRAIRHPIAAVRQHFRESGRRSSQMPEQQQQQRWAGFQAQAATRRKGRPVAHWCLNPYVPAKRPCAPPMRRARQGVTDLEYKGCAGAKRSKPTDNPLAGGGIMSSPATTPEMRVHCDDSQAEQNTASFPASANPAQCGGTDGSAATTRNCGVCSELRDRSRSDFNIHIVFRYALSGSAARSSCSIALVAREFAADKAYECRQQPRSNHCRCRFWPACQKKR